MSDLPIRDQKKDHLLTPKNSALLIIDFQPVQVYSVQSMDKQLLVNNIAGVAKMAKLYNIPIVLTTVNVKTGLNSDTIPQIRKVTGDLVSLDRLSINAWEDKEFHEAVVATGRKKLIICALWTEVCLAFPALDALKEGYEVYHVVDAVGGTSLIAHDAGLRRIELAGSQPVSVAQLFCEMQRSWARTETAQGFIDLFIETGGSAGVIFSNEKDKAETSAKEMA